MSKLLEVLKENPGSIAIYEDGMSLLFKSGVISYLYERAMPQIIREGTDVQVMATQAARSAGYSEALADLINFVEKFINVSDNSKIPVRADFGALTASVKKGDLTKEEADAIIRGNTYNTQTR